MITGVCLAFCVLAACLLSGGKKKMSLDRGEVQRINQHFDKLHPDGASPFE